MNSGFRWPYGRREGALPVWAHRRAAAPGAKSFKRVIFQDRQSEGDASRTTSDSSVDPYYCLSFTQANSGRDSLDAVSCASIFSSDKGRFLTSKDQGYAEPYQDRSGHGSMRVLSLTSLYPPRRDVDRCTQAGCYDHKDVASYKAHALEVMPELDAITQATPEGRRQTTWTFPLGTEGNGISWEMGRSYTLYVEVNVEGDYNEHFDQNLYPTPDQPAKAWDTWAMTYGYPYRGQPSVVYALPFQLNMKDDVTTAEPVGYGDLEGLTGDLHELDGQISNDPDKDPGSGADRLISTHGVRAKLSVARCDASDGVSAPGQVSDVRVTPPPSRKDAHMWAELSFRTPTGPAPVEYDVKVRADGGDWEEAFTSDSTQPLLPVALDVCADPDDSTRDRCSELAPGSELKVQLAGLRPTTKYEIAVTSVAAGCGGSSKPVIAEYTTLSRQFTTVSPCFVATASYGTPLAAQIGVLRRFRDRYLSPHAAGRALVAGYYAVGPILSDQVRERAWLRTVIRSILDPLVALLSWWIP
jgi:hypothetical protein